jgi:hypothetical protein
MAMNAKTNMMFVAILFLVVGCTADKQDSALRSDSPGKRYSAYIQETAGGSGARSLILTVESKEKHAILFSLPLERYAKVVWSPDGNQVAIVDDFASNENRIEIFGLPAGKHLLTISRDEWQNLNSGSPSPTNYSHMYFSDLAWVGPQKVKLKVAMYDRLSSIGPTDYDGSYQLDVAKQ